jgi:hypothetical protein
MGGLDNPIRLARPRIARWIRSPFLAVLSAGLLATSVRFASRQPESVIGQFLPQHWGRCHYRSTPRGHLVRHPDGRLSVITEFDPAYRDGLDWDEVISTASLHHREYRSGVYALTREHHELEIRVDPPRVAVDPAQLASLRVRLYDEYVANLAVWRPAVAAALPDARTADYTASRALWWGYAHNALAILFLVPVSCAARHALSKSAGDRRRRNLLDAAAMCRCAQCEYDLRGITSKVCPECGTSTPQELLRRVENGEDLDAIPGIRGGRRRSSA